LMSAQLVTGPFGTISNVSPPFPVAPQSSPLKFFR